MPSSPSAGTVAEEIGRAAWQAAQVRAPYLIERPAPEDWRQGIASKVVSIFTNELEPLADGRIEDAARMAISEVLGICYLGDYALETGLSFNVAPAASAVADCAVSSGVEEGMAAMLIQRMASFYCDEEAARTGRIYPDLWHTTRGVRYQLKSADICLLQRMTIAGSLGEPPGTHDALDCASAALDVVDDAMDLTEDAQCANGNPLVAVRHDSVRLRAVFEWCVSPYMASMRNALCSGYLPRFAGEYVLSAIERVHACHLTLDCVSE